MIIIYDVHENLNIISAGKNSKSTVILLRPEHQREI